MQSGRVTRTRNESGAFTSTERPFRVLTHHDADIPGETPHLEDVSRPAAKYRALAADPHIPATTIPVHLPKSRGQRQTYIVCHTRSVVYHRFQTCQRQKHRKSPDRHRQTGWTSLARRYPVASAHAGLGYAMAADRAVERRTVADLAPFTPIHPRRQSLDVARNFPSAIDLNHINKRPQTAL
jgi:hypothetical protein